MKANATSALACACLLLAGLPTAPAERVQDLPSPSNYVSDFAGILSPETQASVDALCAQVDRRAHAQIAVVTVQTLDGEPIENFATELEEKWKVGGKGSDRGVILLIAAKDRKYRFEVGYGLEGILPDGKVGSLGRQIVPYFRQGDYDAAVTTAVSAMAGVIAVDAGVTLTPITMRGPPEQPQTQSLTLGELAALAVLLLLVILFLARFGGSGLIGFLLGMFMGGGWGGGGGGWGGGGDGGGGFGGFGGGSSGGGGASGDW